MVKELDCALEVKCSKSSRAIMFTFALPRSYVSNSIIAVLPGWLWYQITREGWYAIKQRNQVNTLNPVPLIIWLEQLKFPIEIH